MDEDAGDRSGAAPGRPARFDKLLSSPRRVRSNVVSGHHFLRARLKRRAHRPRIHFLRYAIVAALVVALASIVFDAPVGAYRNDWPQALLRLGRDMTNFGKSGWLLVPGGVAILIGYGMDWEIWGKRRRILVLKWMAVVGYIFFAVAASGLVTDIVKIFIGRARPEHFHELGVYAFEPFRGASFYSFPSGHATTVGALFASLALLFPRLRLGCLVLALWFGCTRILVGAHYPADVTAGLAWGAWFAYFAAMLFARHGMIFTYDDRGWPIRRSGYRFLRPRRLRWLRRRRPGTGPSR